MSFEEIEAILTTLTYIKIWKEEMKGGGDNGK